MDWIKRLIGVSGTESPALDGDLTSPPGTTASPVHTRYTFSEPSLRIAAVGDVHGRVDLLEALGDQLDELARDPSKRLVEIYLGDYVDRGGDPKSVIEFLMKRVALADRDVICLAGNHEHMLLAALESDDDFISWLGFGGQPTLLSYGVSPANAKVDALAKRMAFRAALPPAHLDFLKALNLSYLRGGFFFVHAGVRPGTPLEQQIPMDLLWIRESFLASDEDFGAVVVHGHTPVAKPQFRPNRIAIDTEAYYSGTLTCLMVTSEAVMVLDRKRVEGAGPAAQVLAT